jgi:hypothetical protein
MRNLGSILRNVSRYLPSARLSMIVGLVALVALFALFVVRLGWVSWDFIVLLIVLQIIAFIISALTGGGTLSGERGSGSDATIRFRRRGSRVDTSTGSIEGPVTNSSLVRVFYATDRIQIPTKKGGAQYDRWRSLFGQIHYGECEISIPKVHKLGKLETPSEL